MEDTLQAFIDKARSLQDSIANDVWPNGWTGTCHECGKPFHYTREECAYYLRHGWPKCDHVRTGEKHGRKGSRDCSQPMV